MHVIRADNVCRALPDGVALLIEHGVRESSRAGPVFVAPHPVTTVYMRPQERVLFSPVRDANPFFHLMEALWMIAGRQDATFLNNFVRDFGQRFAEPGTQQVIHGAYGHRWRQALGFDQLDHVAGVLKKDPSSRQCVIQMWDASLEDFREVAKDLTGDWKDRPCNTHIYLRVREELQPGPRGPNYEERMVTKVLDLTVLCRSNDIVWGAYGANAVHFSVLQEYLAARIGVGVGKYYQVSNNFHIYEQELERLISRANSLRESGRPENGWNLQISLMDDRYRQDGPNKLYAVPLVNDPETFDGEVRWLLSAYEDMGRIHDHFTSTLSRVNQLNNKFLRHVAFPMLVAHTRYRAKNFNQAAGWLTEMPLMCDWRVAAEEWLQRRAKK